MTKIGVFDSALSIISKDQLNTGSENFFKAQFVFNETWQGFKKYAVFFQILAQPKLEVEINEETLIVDLPNEFFVAELPIFVGAYGVKDGVIISTNFAELPVGLGAFGGNLMSFKNTKASIVRSVDTKIQFIRENEKGEFEYSTDGENWKLTSATINYNGVFERLDELDKSVEDIKDVQDNTQDVIKVITKDIDEINDKLDKIAQGEQITLKAGDNIEIVNNVISVKGLEKKFIKTFTKNDFIFDNQTNSWVFRVPQSTYILENAYVANIYVTNAMDLNGNILISEPTRIMYSDSIDYSKNICVYISFDLTKLSAYNGKIIIKGD